MTQPSQTPKPLNALAVASIVHEITYLKYASKAGAEVVYTDGSVEKEGKGLFLYSLCRLTEKLEQYGLCKIEVPHLKLMVTAFEDKYSKGPVRRLEKSDYEELSNAI